MSKKLGEALNISKFKKIFFTTCKKKELAIFHLFIISLFLSYSLWSSSSSSQCCCSCSCVMIAAFFHIVIITSLSCSSSLSPVYVYTNFFSLFSSHMVWFLLLHSHFPFLSFTKCFKNTYIKKELLRNCSVSLAYRSIYWTLTTTLAKKTDGA